MSIQISVQRAVREQGLPSAVAVRRWINSAVRTVAPKKTGQITLRWVDETEGRTLNRQFRHKDYATNVLSFSYEDAPLGDLIVCAPVMIREAAQYSKSLEAHCAHLIVHGLLHLLGHDHQTTRGRATMEAHEVAVLMNLGFSDPYFVD